MAEALRLQIEYKDINQVDTRIEVWQEGYAGATKYLTYANDEVGCEFTWGDTSTKSLPLVYGSKVVMKFDSETDFEFLDFFTANARKNKILIYKDNSLFHASFGEADNWSEPWIPAPYEVQFTGVDGLGLLKKEDFLDSNKDYYEGEMTPLAILQLILSKTGLSLPLNTAISIRPDGASTSADALTQVLKDVFTYRDMNCYEVLEALFRGCRIQQREGEWWIASNDKWNSATITFYNYTAAGAANGTVVKNTRFTGFWREDQGELSFLPAMKQLKVAQDYGYLGNVIKNNNFLSFEDGVFESWTNVNVVPVQRLYDGDGNRYVLLQGYELTSNWRDDPRTRYLKSHSIKLEATASIPTFTLDFALLSNYSKAAILLFGIHLVGSSGTHYNLKADLDDDNEIVHVWEQTSDIKGIPCNDEVREYKTGVWPFRATHRYANAVLTEGWPKDEVTEHFETKTIQIKEGIPETGELTVYLFLPHVGSYMFNGGACFRNIELKFLDQDTDEEPPVETEFTIINDLGNNYTPDDLTLINGSLPTIDNRLAIYHGGFILNGGTGAAVDDWKWDGAASVYGYAELIARYLAAEVKTARSFHQAVMADSVPSVSCTFYDSFADSYYLEAGITYNDRMQTVNGRYVEIVDFNIDDFTIKREELYSDNVTRTVSPGVVVPNSTSTRRGTGRTGETRNTNDETGLYDADYNRVGPRGRLSSDDFVAITDELTGRTVLRETINRTYAEQENHNFNIGQAVRFDSASETYVLAKADSEANARGVMIVSDVYDADTFAAKAAGKVYDDSLTAGKTYVLSPTTDGAIVDIDSVVSWPEDSVKLKVGSVSNEGLVVNIDQVGDTVAGTIITGNATITETPSGTVNGINTVFTLSQTPSTGSVRVYWQGQRLTPGVDYTITGNTITFTNAPRTGTTIIVDYHAQSVSTNYNIVPAGTINGANKVFTLPATPATLAVYYQGQRLTPGVDYTVSGSAITFINAPRTGSTILCDYET